jgi:hypothetical protein
VLGYQLQIETFPTQHLPATFPEGKGYFVFARNIWAEEDE